jgi:hypothetical protein
MYQNTRRTANRNRRPILSTLMVSWPVTHFIYNKHNATTTLIFHLPYKNITVLLFYMLKGIQSFNRIFCHYIYQL